MSVFENRAADPALNRAPSGMGDLEWARSVVYFDGVLALFEGRRPSAAPVQAVCVAHILPRSSTYVCALARLTDLSTILTKPGSYTESARRSIDSLGLPLRFAACDRAWSQDPAILIDLLEQSGVRRTPTVLIDIGGYFAKCLSTLVQHFGDYLLGIVEVTESGAVAYEEALASQEFCIPIATVARSPLKAPENHLVGAAIAFSVERVFRDEGKVLQSRPASVIGYGNIGRAVAQSLRDRGMVVAVSDISPVALAEAIAHGFRAHARTQSAIQSAELIVFATGRNAITRSVIASVRSGVAIATVTSRDSEFADGALEHFRLGERSASGHLWRYAAHDGEQDIWLINDGDAPNFNDGATLGPAIDLLHGETLAAVDALAQGRHASLILTPGGLLEVSEERRDEIAQIWSENFVDQ